MIMIRTIKTNSRHNSTQDVHMDVKIMDNPKNKLFPNKN